MNAPEKGSEQARRGHSGAVRLDPSETRLVMITAAVIAFFVYLIRSTLLPFLIAGIVAYVCTPLLEWLTKRTRLPRTLFALLLFVIIVAIAAAGIVFVGPRIVIDVNGTAADLQQMLQNLAQRSFDDQRINVFGQSFSPADVAQALLPRIRNW
jgi:predicted PurR-regulated permease PerM